MSSKTQSITVNGVKVPQSKIGIKEAIELLGWRDAKEGEVGYPYVGPKGKGKFVLAKNKTNRPFKRQLAEQYKRQFLRGEWAGQWNSPSRTHNGETIVIDSDGGIVSFAHRGAGLILAELERQRLNDFADGPDSPAAKKLKEYGCNGPITIDVLVVEGVDPNSADTVDIGRTRTHGDVLFRHHEFNGKELPPGVEAHLSRELAVALRLVRLRLKGLQVSRGPKGEIPELLSFGEQHPLLLDALMHIYEVDGGSGKEGKKISRYISLGYAAGLMYLAAFSQSNRESFEDGSLSVTSKPEDWEKAAEFWTLFANDLYSEENVIKSLHSSLEKNRTNRRSKYSRDTLCTLVTRSFLSWTGADDSWSVQTLTKGLNSKDSDVLRFGGLDLNRAALEKMGVMEEDQPLVRTHSGNWRVGNKPWVVGSEFDTWLGTIKSFTDDGEEARVIDEDGQYVDCKIEWLKAEKPEEAKDD